MAVPKLSGGKDEQQAHDHADALGGGGLPDGQDHEDGDDGKPGRGRSEGDLGVVVPRHGLAVGGGKAPVEQKRLHELGQGKADDDRKEHVEGAAPGG